MREGLVFWYWFGIVRVKGIAMKLYLGVDGGGTGCRAAVADGTGRVLGRGEGAASNIMSDPEGARENILAAARAALAAADTDAGLEDLHAVLGLAGANVAKAASRLMARLPFASARLESDALIALKGALGDEDGVTAAIGTGSIFASQRAGAARMIGGWGFRLGDQGSGARMGRDLLEQALLAHDGLRPRSPLLDEVVVEAGGPEGLVAFAQDAAPADFARYARRLIEADLEGDEGAAFVLARADADIAAAIDHLRIDGAVPICFLGGLGKLFETRLGDRYAGEIAAPKGSALDGALAMARGAA